MRSIQENGQDGNRYESSIPSHRKTYYEPQDNYESMRNSIVCSGLSALNLRKSELISDEFLRDRYNRNKRESATTFLKYNQINSSATDRVLMSQPTPPDHFNRS